MIIKTKIIKLHMMDLVKTFKVLKRYNICLNPSKCAFRVSSEKYLRFIIH